MITAYVSEEHVVKPALWMEETHVLVTLNVLQETTQLLAVAHHHYLWVIRLHIA